MPDGTLEQMDFMFIGEVELSEEKDSTGNEKVPDIKGLDELMKRGGYYPQYYIVINRENKKPVAKVYGR